MTKIINIYSGEKYDIYIGRAGHGKDGYFGNPFILNKDCDRDEVLAKYKNYFYNRIENDREFLNKVLQLKNKVLGCFCKPKKCHGDIIVEFLDKYEHK